MYIIGDTLSVSMYKVNCLYASEHEMLVISILQHRTSFS